MPAADVMAGARENVAVCVRLRPSEEEQSVWTVDASSQRIAPTPQHPALAKRAGSSAGGAAPASDDDERSAAAYDFRFDHLVLGHERTECLYDRAVFPVVRAAMEGYNGTVFAYGQTGSGKTHTMSGTRDEPGVIPCAVHDVFAMIRDAPEREFLLRVSFLEIYNETLKDLLAPPGAGGAAGATPSRGPATPTRTAAPAPRIVEERGRITLANLHEEVVTTPAEVLALLERGEAARHVGATDWNTRSSRSHSVFQLTIESREAAQGGVRVSQLNLIDLAGSERAASELARRKEGAYINKSLLTLGTVIAKLTEPGAHADAHIPYRDSKLTRLLQTSLSGDARVAVICTIAQESSAAQETLSTLKFGRRCKMVVTKAQKHVTVDDKALLEQYRRELDTLRARLEASAGASAPVSTDSPPHTPPRRAADLEALRSEHAAEAQQVADLRETRQGLKAQIDHLTRLILTSRNVAAETPQRSHLRVDDVAASPRRGPRMSDLPARSTGAVPWTPGTSSDLAHHAELASLRKELRLAREAHHDAVHALQEELSAARLRAEEALAEADDAHAEVREVQIAIAEVRAELDVLRAEADEARADADVARADAEDARADADEARADAEAVRREAAWGDDAEAARAEAQAAQEEADAARAEADEWREACEAAQADADAARAEAEAAHADADAARADAAQAARALREAREAHATDEAHREFRELVGATHPVHADEKDAAHLYARIAALERALAEERATRDMNSLPERPLASPMRARKDMTPPRVPLRTRSTGASPEPARPDDVAALKAQIAQQQALITTLNQSVDGWQTRVQMQAHKIAQLAAMVEGEDAEVPSLADEPARGTSPGGPGVRARSPAPAVQQRRPRSTEAAGRLQAADAEVRRERCASPARATAALAVPPAPMRAEHEVPPRSPPRSPRSLPQPQVPASPASPSARRPLPQPAAPAARLPTSMSQPAAPAAAPCVAWAADAADAARGDAGAAGAQRQRRGAQGDGAGERAPLPPVPRRRAEAPRVPVQRSASGARRTPTLGSVPESPGRAGETRGAGARGPPPSHTVRARLSAFVPSTDDGARRPTQGKGAAGAERVRDASILRELNDLRAMPRVESSRTMYTTSHATVASDLAHPRPSAAAYKTDASHGEGRGFPASGHARRSDGAVMDVSGPPAEMGARVPAEDAAQAAPAAGERASSPVDADAPAAWATASCAYEGTGSEDEASVAPAHDAHAAAVHFDVPDVVPATLAFADVYNNDASSIREVVLHNPTDDACSVTLHGAPGVRWTQLRAQNAAPPTPLWAASEATNTVAWVRADGLSPAHLRAMRHMAANLETVTSLTLVPHERRVLYVEVRVREVASAAEREIGTQLVHLRTALGVDVGGRTTALPVHISTAAVDVTLALAHAPPRGADGERAERAAAAGRERTLVLDVGDVVVGESVSRTLHLTNRSAIECFAQFQRQGDDAEDGRDPRVHVVDLADGRALPLVAAPKASTAYAPVPLAAHATRTLAVVLEPRAPCANYEQTLTLVNLHAQSESVRVLIRANILGATSDEALAILNACPLDFGDCCGGQWTRQLLILKNTADVPLDVRFQADKDVEVTFQLADLAQARDTTDDDGEGPGTPDVDSGDDDVPLGGSSTTAAARARQAASPPRAATPPGADESDAASSNASQAGSRVASPEPEAAREAEAGVPAARIAPLGEGALGAEREPARLASYSVSALAAAQRAPPVSAQRRMHDPVAMLRGAGESQHNHLEELVLRPGAQYRVVVSHRPPREALDATYSAGRLREAAFRIYLDHARLRDNARAPGGMQRQTIDCHLRTCTPFISVSPKVVDFGVAGVGTRKPGQIAVTNHADLSTRILLRFVSKVLSMYMDPITVPARQTVEVRMDFFPRRVNDAYRKQITVMNLLNRPNDQIFEVRARNVDLQRVSFHSLFYRILTRTGANYLDFGDVNIHSSRVRSFAIENLCAERLVLELSVAHPEDLVLYVKAPPHADAPPAADGARDDTDARARPRAGTERKERFLETISTDATALARTDAHAGRAPRTPRPARRDEARAARPVRLDLGAALKRGLRGRVTYRYGAAVTFKDRTLLHSLEALDLASGPPVDAARLSAKARRVQRLQARDGDDAPDARHTRARAAAPARRTGAASVVPAVGRGGATPSPPRAAKPAAPAPRTDASPALTGQLRAAAPMLSDPAEVAHLDVDELIAALVAQSPNLSTFFLRGLEAEERVVRTEINLQRALRAAIEGGQLVPIGMLHVPPHAEVQVVAVYTPSGTTRPHIQGTARKQDSRIFLRLLEFDAARAAHLPEFAALQRRDVDELPVRDLMVRSTVCRSMLELGQPHINFGAMDKGEKRERKLWIQNRSEWALRYYIRKSGSIASGDIRLGLGRYGVVPGYGKRGVDFVFSPSLSGPFYERLLVENIADHDNDQPVVLKAAVRKVANFATDPGALDFGTCRAGQASMPESVLVSNTTNKARAFVVRIDESLVPPVPLDVLVATSDDSVTHRTLSREEEEEVETLLQKLKIAERKGNTDKLAKYRERLQHLGAPVPPAAGTDAGSEHGSEASSEHDGATHTGPAGGTVAGTAHAVALVWPPSRAHGDEARTALTLHLAAQQSQKLLLRVRVPRGTRAADVHVGLRVHEVKNSDETRPIHIHARTEP
ncbi:hypothetical protein MBRA1_001396 [Malassezia brasiliensis]|uniref:Kinesin motor domain-containing protein n=1 Tax=Malassezia brasiliensis TaxID=1821822 RepID=A0AAF0DSR0_9BASI|nr:hypothetical protein MBRA1_001396 [Malassezia brasiliensis]